MIHMVSMIHSKKQHKQNLVQVKAILIRGHMEAKFSRCYNPVLLKWMFENNKKTKTLETKRTHLNHFFHQVLTTQCQKVCSQVQLHFCNYYSQWHESPISASPAEHDRQLYLLVKVNSHIRTRTHTHKNTCRVTTLLRRTTTALVFLWFYLSWEWWQKQTAASLCLCCKRNLQRKAS